MSDPYLGKVIRSTGLDDEFMSFKRVKAGSEEWKTYMDGFNKMLEHLTDEQQTGIRHRDINAPNWRNEDLYYVVFADGREHPITRKDIWPAELYEAFENRPNRICSVHPGEFIVEEEVEEPENWSDV